MTQRFGSAASLYARRQHPRVLYSAADLEKLRTLARTGDGARILAALRGKAALLADRVEAWPDVPGALTRWNANWKDPATAVVMGLHDLAFVAVLDNDVRLIAIAKQVLLGLLAADKIMGRSGKQIGYGLQPFQLLAYDLLFEHLTPGQRRAFTKWAVDYCVRLTLQRRPNYLARAGMNIPMGEVLTGMMGLLVIAGDPGVPRFQAETKWFVTALEATVHCAIGPAGYPNEDIGYGAGMAGWTAYLVEAAYRAGLLDAYERCPHFLQTGRALLHFVQPWGQHLSNTGDHGDDFGERSLILAQLAARTKDPAVEWLRRELYYPPAEADKQRLDPAIWGEVSLGKNQQVPRCAFSLLALLQPPPRPLHPGKCGVPTGFVDTGRGIVTLRSSWRPDAALVVFDGAQRSAAVAGHDHASAGHFSLSALGEYFGIDTGRYNIEQDQHNVVLINGKSGRSTGGEWRFLPQQGLLLGHSLGAFVDTAAADSSHQSNCILARRTIGLVKGDRPYAWTVEDLNADNGASGPSEYWWTLNTHPDNTIALARDHATIQGRRQGNLLDVHFALPGATEFSIPHSLRLAKNLQLSGSQGYVTEPLKKAREQRKLVGDLVHGPVYARPRLVAKIKGLNGRFMAIMLPRLQGERPATVRQLAGLTASLGVVIRWADCEDTLLWAYEHRLLEGNGVSARGQWAVVRRALRQGKAAKVLDYAVGQGTRIEVDGARLKLK